MYETVNTLAFSTQFVITRAVANEQFTTRVLVNTGSTLIQVANDEEGVVDQRTCRPNGQGLEQAPALHAYRVAQKSKPPPIFQKIVLKIADEIRFLRKVKV